MIGHSLFPNPSQRNIGGPLHLSMARKEHVALHEGSMMTSLLTCARDRLVYDRLVAVVIHLVVMT